jgi:Na+/H+ antiporter NhaD/arsenite permease-like protein
MASTFAGNLTIAGSVANIIVVERAGAEGVQIGLRDYGRAGCRHDRDADLRLGLALDD